MSSEYRAWTGMRIRCNNPNNRDYKNYGGRGIKVCERWNSFENFIQDMGNKPAGHSLDRIDNDGDYSPSNCKWSSKTEQQSNRRVQTNNTSGIAGIRWEEKDNHWTVKLKGKYLGCRTHLFEAVCLRKSAELQL